MCLFLNFFSSCPPPTPPEKKILHVPWSFLQQRSQQHKILPCIHVTTALGKDQFLLFDPAKADRTEAASRVSDQLGIRGNSRSLLMQCLD